jgi:transposase
MDEYARVRRLRFIDGLTLRAISRETGFHRDTIKKMLALGAPPGYRRRQAPERPKLGPFVGVIDAILKADRKAPPKQRHTAKRIFDRLREEHGYTGGYTQVRAYVAEVRNLHKEAFVPLAFGPGEAQVDWGEAWVRLDGVERKAHLFVMTLPFSDARFVAAFPRPTLEFFLEGHERAFRFFSGVPRRIIYDNLKSAVTKVGRGRRRDRNSTFEAFSERYLFESAFCNVGQGHEKGHVENGVGWARRNLFTPRPRFSDWGAFNAELAERCRRQWTERLRGHERTVGERLDEQRATLLPIPRCAPLDQALEPQTASSLCLVRFDTNDYSVPCRYAHHDVFVRADVGRVRIFHDDRCIAAHTRCHEREKAVYEPWHYLALIERKPRALDYGAPMQRLELDACFAVLRRRLEDGQEHSEGTRAYIRVLRLLEKHSVACLTRSVRQALDLGVVDYEAIRLLLLSPAEKPPTLLDLTGRAHLAAYRIAPPDLSAYNTVAQGGAR